jgi:ankyrin repeat protein
MIQKLIKEKQYDEIIKYYTSENINEIDKFGRTILHNLIINKLPLDIFQDMIDKGANPYLKDKSGQNAMIKAIKFKDVDVIKYLINYGFELNSDIGIIDTPWFFARNDYNIADLLIATIQFVLDSMKRRNN